MNLYEFFTLLKKHINHHKFCAKVTFQWADGRPVLCTCGADELIGEIDYLLAEEGSHACEE